MNTGKRSWSWNRSGRVLRPYAWGRSLCLGMLGVGLSAIAMPRLAGHAAEAEAWHHLPENTALVMLIDTTADTWGQLNQFQLFNLLAVERGLTTHLPGLPYLPYGFDFESDIAPWVGDTAVVALLPALPNAEAAIADHTVMVAPVANTDGFESFRATFFKLQEEDPEITSVLGADIYFWPAPVSEDWPGEEPGLACGPAEAGAELCDDEMPPIPNPPEDGASEARGDLMQPQVLHFSGGISLPLTATPFHEGAESPEDLEVEVPVPLPAFGPAGLAVAFLPDAVVTAESPVAIEQYLRQAESTPSLADNQEFQRTLANRQRSRALFAVYGNALELLNYEFSTAALPDLPLPLPPSPTLDAGMLRSLNFGGTLEALVYPQQAGMQFRGRYYYDAVPFTFGLTPTVADADSPLALLPAATFLMMSGRNLAGFWRNATRILETASDVTRQGLATARSFFTLATGLDLDQDVFGWMDGEMAIAAFPTEGGPLQYLGVSLLLQTSDRPTAENTLAAVDDLVTTFGLTAYPHAVNQQPAVSWELPLSRDSEDYQPLLSVGSHGWVTDDTLAITSGVVPMAEVLAPSPHDPLADFFLFDQATATFPDPNNGYFYLNVGATLALVYQVFDLHNDSAFDTTKPYLGSVRSLSATTAQTANYMEIRGQMGLASRQN